MRQDTPYNYLLQSKCFQSDTSYQYIYPNDNQQFIIPNNFDDSKLVIQKLVFTSYKVELDAQRFLEQAKTRVEQMIKKAVQHDTIT